MHAGCRQTLGDCSPREQLGGGSLLATVTLGLQLPGGMRQATRAQGSTPQAQRATVQSTQECVHGLLALRHGIVGMSPGRQPAGVGQGSQQHGSTPVRQEMHLEQGSAMAGQARGQSTCYLWSRETTAEACPQLDMPQCVQGT